MARTEEEYSQQSMAQLPTEQGEWVTYNLLVKFTHLEISFCALYMDNDTTH